MKLVTLDSCGVRLIRVPARGFVRPFLDDSCGGRVPPRAPHVYRFVIRVLIRAGNRA